MKGHDYHQCNFGFQLHIFNFIHARLKYEKKSNLSFKSSCYKLNIYTQG